MAEARSNLIRLYLKFQLKFLVGLMLFIVLPFFCLSLFWPDLPHMHYYFLGLLFAIKLLAMDDNKYEKSLKKVIPSFIKSNATNNVYHSTKFVVLARNINLVLCGIIVLIIYLVRS